VSLELPKRVGAVEPARQTDVSRVPEPTGAVEPPELAGAIEPSAEPRTGAATAPHAATASEAPRCGRWKLKPFEFPRPVLLRPDGPVTLAAFLARPDPTVLDEFARLDLEAVQALVLARLRGAPPDMRLSLFGQAGYTMRDVVRHVEEGTPLGVRVIDAERKLVGLLLTEALRVPD